MMLVQLFSHIWSKPGLIYVYLQLMGLESRVNQKGFLQNRAPVACLSANPKPIKNPFSSGLQAECFVYQSHTVVDLSYRISLLLSLIFPSQKNHRDAPSNSPFCHGNSPGPSLGHLSASVSRSKASLGLGFFHRKISFTEQAGKVLEIEEGGGEKGDSVFPLSPKAKFETQSAYYSILFSLYYEK